MINTTANTIYKEYLFYFSFLLMEFRVAKQKNNVPNVWLRNTIYSVMKQNVVLQKKMKKLKQFGERILNHIYILLGFLVVPNLLMRITTKSRQRAHLDFSCFYLEACFIQFEAMNSPNEKKKIGEKAKFKNQTKYTKTSIVFYSKSNAIRIRSKSNKFRK